MKFLKDTIRFDRLVFLTLSVAFFSVGCAAHAQAATMNFRTGVANPNTSGAATVTFSLAMPSTEYAILLAGGSDTDSMYSMAYLGQLISGFQIKAEDDTGFDEPNTGSQWAAFQSGVYDFGGNLIMCSGGEGTWQSEAINVTSPNYPSNYPNNHNSTQTITKTGAQKIRVHFSNFNTESCCDQVTLRNGSGGTISTHSGNLGAFTSVDISGDTVQVQFTSDGSVNASGWRIDQVEWTTSVLGGGGLAGNNVVVFGSSFPDTNYAILASATDDVDSPAVNYVSGSKQVGQVTIRIEDDGGVTEAVTNTSYCAFKHGEYAVGSAQVKSGSSVTAGSGDTTVTFSSSFPDTNYVVIATAQATSGSLCAPEVVSKATSSFTIRFENDDGSNCASKSFDWVAISLGEFSATDGAAAPIVTISATPNPVGSASPFTVDWSSTGAISCAATDGTPGWSGSRPTVGSYAVPSGILVPTYFTLSCTGPGGTTENQVLVNLAGSVSVTIDANPLSVGEAGESVLTWSAVNATSCTASGDWSGAKTMSGSEYVYPSVDSTYTLDCSGPGGSGSDFVTVTVSSIGFVEPLGSPLNSRTNAGPLLNVGWSYQEKGARPSGASGVGLAMDFFVAVSRLCLGPSNCITNWWPSIIQPASCQLEVKRVYGTPLDFGSTLTSSPCDHRLSVPAKAAGWVATGMDRWSHGTVAASAVSSCTFTRLVCTGGITSSLPISSGILTHPVTNAQTGDGFDFTYTPQCNDGIDNDGDQVFGLYIDFPTDGGCTGYGDAIEN